MFQKNNLKNIGSPIDIYAPFCVLLYNEKQSTHAQGDFFGAIFICLNYKYSQSGMLREDIHSFRRLFIRLGFSHNGEQSMSKSNRNTSVSNYFTEEVVNGSNFELSVALERVKRLTGLFEDVNTSLVVDENNPPYLRKDAKVAVLAHVIKLVIETAQDKLHADEEKHMNVFEMGGGNG
jgi:hypothetical protein